MSVKNNHKMSSKNRKSEYKGKSSPCSVLINAKEPPEINENLVLIAVEIDHEIISTVITESFKKVCGQLQAKVYARSTG